MPQPHLPESDLPSRVARIEAGLEALAADVGQFVAATTNSIRQLGEQSAASSSALTADLRKIASETNASITALSLSQEQSRRTPWGTLASWASVMLLVGGIFGSIVMGRIDAVVVHQSAQDAKTLTDAYDFGRRDTEIKFMQTELDRLRAGKAP